MSDEKIAMALPTDTKLQQRLQQLMQGEFKKGYL